MPHISAKSPYLLAAAISFVVTLLIVSPSFFLGNASGHDFEFHIASWLDVSKQWHQGIFFPRWAEWPNHGFGEPRFLFYPPLSWLLAPALTFFVPWNFVPVAFIVLVQTFAGISAFALAKRILPTGSLLAPLVSAAAYAANPNALLIIYMRSDFAELLASAFFPLLLLAVLQLTNQLPQAAAVRNAHLRAGLAFAAVFATIWLSNAPAGVMVTYAMTLVLVWIAFVQRSARPLVRGAASMALGFGLSAFYLIPAAYEQRWVNISQVLSSGLLPSQNFLYTTINDPEHNLFNWMASTTAILMIVMTGLAALAAIRSHAALSDSDHKLRNTQIFHLLLILAAAATLMMLRPTNLLWELLPKLRFVQFPWRWMSTLAVPYACFLGLATTGQQSPAGRAPRALSRFTASLWILATAVTVAASAVFFVHHTWWDPDDVPTMQAALSSGDGFEGADEYDPVGDDHYNLPTKAPEAQLLPRASSPPNTPSPLPTSLVILRWTPEEKLVRLDSTVPARLGLRLLNYPAWHIKINGTPVQPLPPSDTNQMILAVPAGQSLVHVTFTGTPDRTTGALLSLASALFALALLGIAKSAGQPDIVKSESPSGHLS